jgi:hypothetical protein
MCRLERALSAAVALPRPTIAYSYVSATPLFEMEEEPPPLPIERQATALHGWKRATIVWSDGVPRLAGAVTRCPVDVESQAVCCLRSKSNFSMPGWLARDFYEPQHRAPADRCTCGFYAVPDRVSGLLDSTVGIGRAEVELHGQVVEHEDGWRAEKQRILGLTLDAECQRATCHLPAAYVVPIGVRSLTDLGGSLACRRCVEEFGIWNVAVLPAELAGILGTEIRLGQSL